MIINSLLQNCKKYVASTGASAGTTTITTNWIPIQDAAAVLFEVLMGTLTSTNVTTIKAQYSSDGSTSLGDVAGSLVTLDDTMGSKLVLLEINRPGYAYVRLSIGRATANAVITSVTATVYNLSNAPSTQPTAQVSATKGPLNAPILGTA